MTDALVIKQPVDAGWLWSQHNEHRIPLPKLVLIALYSLSGWDFRAGMYFNIVLLAALAAGAVKLASRQRGFVSYADAFFPLALLSWGHYENLLWSWQVTQVIPIGIAIALLLVIVRWAAQPTLRTALIAAVAVAALPLCGIAGLVFVPGFALWLLAAGRNLFQSPQRKARAGAFAIWTIGAIAVALIPLYFNDLHIKARVTHDPWAVLQTSVAFLAQGFGPAAGRFKPLVEVFVVAMMVATTLVLVGALRSADGARRSHALCLLFYLGAFGGMLLSVGIGRQGTGFPNRYALFAVPALCWIYLAWGAFSRPDIARAIQGVLFLFVLSLVSLNFDLGREYAKGRRQAVRAMETDIRAGQPPSQIIAAHQKALLPFPEDGGAYGHKFLEGRLAALRTKHAGALAHLGSEMAFRQVPLTDVARVHADSTGKMNEIWTLPEKRFVYGIRLLRPAGLALADNTERGKPTTIYWRSSGKLFSKAGRGVHWWSRGQTSATFWIYAPVTEFAVDAESAPAPRVMLLVR
ncbi:hypothetical protein GCM10027085_65020 [Spirosoma aerophilum]